MHVTHQPRHPPLQALSALLLLLGIGACSNATDEAPRRPNVLFISIDDLRPELGAYGSLAAVSPQLDRLAAEGMRFERAYCQVALCNPSRASVLTGCRPATTGVVDFETHFRGALPDVKTLPRIFKENGYSTWSLGKVLHHKNLDPEAWTEEEFLPDRKAIYGTEENRKLNRPRRKGPPLERAEVADDAYRDGMLTRRAIELLESAGEQPFFMALGYYKPHLPLAAPARYWDLHGRETIETTTRSAPPVDAPPCSNVESGELRLYLDVPPSGPLEESLARELVHGYHACVSFVDDQVGQVLDALDRTGLAEDTIVVVWSDHGWYLGEHGLWAKTGVRELGLRTPLIVRMPGKGRGTNDDLIELVDLYPTLCELAGLDRPEHLEGRSFAGILGEGDYRPEEYAFSEHHGAAETAYSLRSADWRFNLWLSPQTGAEIGVELYDLREDLIEGTNLAGDPDHAELVSRFRRELALAWPEAFRS